MIPPYREHPGEHPFDDGSIVPDIGVALDRAPNDRSHAMGPEAQNPDTEYLTTNRPASVGGSRQRIIAVLAGLLVVALVGAFFLGRSDDQPATAAEDIPQEGGADAGAQDASGPVVAGDPNFPPSDEHLAADAIGEVFQTQINGEDAYAVAYNSQRGLQILSARGASTPEVEVAVGFNEAARFPLLSDGKRTWAINTRTPDLAYLVSTQFVVVDVGLEGSVAFINNSLDPVNIGISSFGAWGPGFNVPAGADLLAIPGRGILIAPATGGTFRLTQFGVVKISDDRVVAAGLNSEVFQRCDDELACELYSTSLEYPDEFVLDVDPAAEVFISPRGRHVLSIHEGAATIIDVADGSQRPIQSVEGATGASWAPDGTFVAIIDGETMVFAFTDGEEVPMTMPILPDSSAVLVLDA